MKPSEVLGPEEKIKEGTMFVYDGQVFVPYDLERIAIV